MIQPDITDMIFAVEEGNANPLEIYCALHKLEAQVKAAKEQIKHLAIDEASKHGKTFTFMGFEIQQKALPGRWTFDHIDDWNSAKFKMKTIEDLAKWAYKSHEKGVQPITDDGEVITPANYTPGGDTIALREVEA
jgi:hypothetical protein